MPRLYQSRDWLTLQYKLRGLSIKEIAALTGATEITIRTYLDKYGLLKKRKNK